MLSVPTTQCCCVFSILTGSEKRKGFILAANTPGINKKPSIRKKKYLFIYKFLNLGIKILLKLIYVNVNINSDALVV
ncbi:MAG: hypothetical protein DRP13_04655 [Candidatus Aenigmatarchaeota archaeon]|nr:MAG: hypothetical protein DRP13_04655 [Candidatus Aenigmarchaeota archaeon]